MHIRITSTYFLPRSSISPLVCKRSSRPRLSDDSFVFSRTDVLQSALEVAFRDLQAGIGFALVGLQVRVDQFDETVEVLDRDGFVALIEIVHVSVEDLDEEFNGYGSVHASVGDAESALETFENALAIAVELYRLVQSGFSLV